MFASPPKLLDKPQTFITAFHYTPDKTVSYSGNLQKHVVKNFPNVTVVDTSIIVNQIRSVLENAINIIKLFFIFSVFAAFLVLWSSLLALREEREREVAILRILGCSKRNLTLAQLFELIYIGLVAGGLGSVFAQMLGNLIFYVIFTDIGFDFSSSYVFYSVITGILVSVVAGYYAMFRISQRSGVSNLRSFP